MTKKKANRPDPASFQLPESGVDSHAHLDLRGLIEDVQGVIQRANDVGLCKIGQVFLGPDAYAKNKGFFEDNEGFFFFILGIHPHEAKDCSTSALDKIERALVEDNRIKAVGEIGLDFHYDYSPRESQKKAFKDQLCLAKERSLPVVIHCREAEKETMEILADQGFEDYPLLWHCFGRDSDFAKKVIRKGWMLSIPGTVTFPKSIALQKAVSELPLENLLLETDCPFLTPAPYRGKQNEPSLMAFTAEKVAKLKDMHLEEVWTKTGDNAFKFFKV